jgi:TRAP-type C4-dicarboxylate transport system permease small subunit
MRYFFSRSQNWAEEIASMGFAWVVFVGAAAVYKRNMHIGIDAFVNLLTPGLRNLIGLGMTTFLVVLNIYLTYLSLVFSIAAWAKPTHILLIPYTFVDLSSTVGFACMTGHAVVDLAEKIKGRGVAQRTEG